MRLEHTFTVPVPVEAAWQVLLDLERIAPCLPGATVTGVDGDDFTGTVKVKLGPVTLTYRGKGRFVERDEAAHRAVVEASGRDTRSAGTASATVTSTLTADDTLTPGGATRVDVVTDLSVTGRPAQFGRSMIADVSAKLIGQFADCLAETLTAGPAAVTTATEPALTAEEARPTEAEPIDLLRVTGGTPTARRLAGYAIAGLLTVLAWLAFRRRRRR